jgi:PucR family transcriptional regulator, purine catabolism regulatory protein
MTYCPMGLVLRDVIQHPKVTPAAPVLLSGELQLDHAVRWVHTADLYDIAPLLRGDEVLLTNGVGLVGVDGPARRVYVRRLAERGVAGLFFEVGRGFPAVPAEMVAEARELNVAIVELQPVLRFTEVAEAVNSELIDRSVARLRHADETSRLLSEALARGASLEELVAQVAKALGTWAQLSDYAGRVVVGAVPIELEGGDQAMAQVPVLVEDVAWGRLSVGTQGTEQLLVEAVLDRAPTVLGLCLLRGQQEFAGTLRAQQLLLGQLVSKEPTDVGVLEARLRAAGVATSDVQYVCLAADPQRVPAAAQLIESIVLRVGNGTFGMLDGILFALVAGQPVAATPNLAGWVRQLARDAVSGQRLPCIAVSRTVRELSHLQRSMAETRDVLQLGRRLHARGGLVAVQDYALERFLADEVDRDAVRLFAEIQVGILLKADRAKGGGQLARTLVVLVECGGNKVATAQRLHVRRQSLYYRLNQIKTLLDVDLDDPKQFIAISVAVVARRVLTAYEPSSRGEASPAPNDLFDR